LKFSGVEGEINRMAFDAVHWREEGVRLRQQGRFAEAVDAIRRALEGAPDDAEAWNELAHALRFSGQLTAAREAAGRSLKLNPELAAAWFNLGAVRVAQADATGGIEDYRKALALKPDFAEAWSNLGIALGQQNRRDEEIDAYRRALEINPDLAMVWSNLGGVLAERNEIEEAIAAHRRAVEIDPQLAQGWSNLGDTLREAGRFDEAIAACEQAVALDAGMAGAWNNLGVVRTETGELDQARLAFQRAVASDSGLAQAWGNLGSVSRRLGRITESIAAHMRATELAADNPIWWRGLAHALRAGQRLADAAAALRRAANLRPAHAGIRADLIYSLLEICDWGDLDTHVAQLCNPVSTVASGEEAAPHGKIMWCDNEASNLATAQLWAKRISKRYPPEFAVHHRRAITGKRITIGYLSSDIHNHATAHLMRGVFRLHDHERFKINIYSYGPDDNSDYRAEIGAASDVVRDIRAVGHRAAAEQIEKDGVDILVDMKGWTDGVRWEICALRPAPLQMTYLGFPGSCGADFIDYAIVDAVVVPPESARYYSEKLIYLPHCYQANDNQQIIAPNAYQRSDFGLPGDGIVICSFNRPEKFDPATFATWMRILRRAPRAVLWLLASNRWALENLKREAVARGISPERLILAEGLSKPQHLRRLQLADVALDTRICNGHTTTSDTLWAGVPVVALLGKHFASRVSASCLGAMAMPELVTRTIAEYEDLAVKLATDHTYRGRIKAKIENNRLREPLFDTRRFTRNLERAYAQAWKYYAAGESPRIFAVEEPV
jgi:protein O-GlcNAc transferase